MKNFVRDLFSVGRSKAFIMVSGFAKGVILARWLGPEQVGELEALLVYPTLLMSIGSLGLQQATTYFYGKDIYPLEAIKRAIVQTWCLSTTLSLAGCYLMLRYVSSSGDSLLLVALAIAPIPFALFNKYNGGLFLGRNDIESYNRIDWIPASLGLLGTIILVVLIDTGIPGALLAGLVGPAIMSIVLTFRNDFLRSISLQVEWNLIKKLLSLGSVYAIALMAINLNYRLDVILLDRLSTDFQVGIYSKGVSPLEYLWQIPMLLSTIIFARSATARDGMQFSRNVHQLLRVSLLAVGAASLVLAVTAERVITLLYGEAFRPSGSVLAVLIPGVVLLTMFKVLNMDLAGKGKPWVSMKAMVPSLLINVGLNVLMIPEHGAWGAALASTISYSIAAVLFLVFYAQAIGISVREIMRYRRSDFAPVRKLIGMSATLVSR